jgi:hypothetical protein
MEDVPICAMDVANNFQGSSKTSLDEIEDILLDDDCKETATLTKFAKANFVNGSAGVVSAASFASKIDSPKDVGDSEALKEM